MRAIKIIIYLIFGVTPASFLCLLTMPVSITHALTFPGILPLLGTIGLWLATLDFLFESAKQKLAIAMLLLAGVAAISPFSMVIIKDVFANGLESEFMPDALSIVEVGSTLTQFALFISPVLIAIHYIWGLYSGNASNKRLQGDAATPRA